MLNITTQSENVCTVAGILNEMNIEEKTDKNGKDYISGTAKIRVDQEIDGKVVESEVPVRMFSYRIKNDGTDNMVYDRIKGYKDNFISASAVDDISKATRVICSGKTCNLKESMWPDRTTGQIRTGFEIDSNFLNLMRDSDSETADFILTGVVLNTREEMNGEEPTGRLIVSFGVIGYNGQISVLDLIAEDTKRASIESGWNQGDTVKVVGKIVVSNRTVQWKEELGFGEPIIRRRTESRRELIIMGGSPNGFEESRSYDADDIKNSLNNRKKYMEELKNRAKSAPAKPAAPSNGFTF